ncbi:hypothetical protein DsansV1_C25g0186671 [Dioscorea sansibarensis]
MAVYALFFDSRYLKLAGIWRSILFLYIAELLSYSTCFLLIGLDLSLV